MGKIHEGSMKILYDISLLGRGYSCALDRTGLYRFAEETLKHLSSNNTIDLYLTTSQLNFSESSAYIAEHFPTLSSKILNPQSSASSLFIKWLQWSLTNFRTANIMPRTMTKIEHHLGFLLEYLGFSFPFIPNHKKEFFDVYFSPKYQIPKQVAMIKSIRKIIFLHDMLPMLYPQFSPLSSRVLYKHLVSSFNNNMLILCNSITTKNDLLKFRPDIIEKNTHILPLCTSPIFKPTNDELILTEIKTKYNIPLQSKYIFTISSLNPRKNFSHVIRSFIAFIKEYNIDDLYLVVTGPKGWHFSDIFQTLDDLGDYKSKIILTGFVDEEELPYLYTGALASVCASLYEGFGYPALESMQCGTPAIVSGNSSLAEVVGDAGIKIDPQNQEDLINALYRIYHDKDYRGLLIRSAYKQAEKFSPKKFANSLAKLLKSTAK